MRFSSDLCFFHRFLAVPNPTYPPATRWCSEPPDPITPPGRRRVPFFSTRFRRVGSRLGTNPTWIDPWIALVFMLRLGVAVISAILVWTFGSPCRHGLCWLVLEVSALPWNLAFIHSPYGLSLVSCVLTFRHSFNSCPILPQVKHHPTNRSYRKATQTSSLSGLTTDPPPS